MMSLVLFFPPTMMPKDEFEPLNRGFLFTLPRATAATSYETRLRINIIKLIVELLAVASLGGALTLLFSLRKK